MGRAGTPGSNDAQVSPGVVGPDHSWVLGLVLCVLFGAGVANCGKPAAPLSDSGRLGQKTYMAICVACHNVDPRFPGATGPELQNATLDLLRSKVIHKTYPAGYKPKRQTKDMPAFSQVTEAELAGLFAFLNHPR